MRSPSEESTHQVEAGSEEGEGRDSKGCISHVDGEGNGHGAGTGTGNGNGKDSGNANAIATATAIGNVC